MKSAAKRLSIIAVDPIDPQVRQKLEKTFRIDQKTNLTKNELLKIIGGYDALIGRTSTKIDADIINAATNLRCIGVHATGWDHIDLDAATKRGIAVLGFPSQKKGFKEDRLRGSFIAAAEHVLLGMLAAAGDFYQTVETMKAGRWEKYAFAGSELYGKTLGIIGLGRIGSLVAERAVAFGMRVIAYAPTLSASEAAKRGAIRVTLPRLLKEADYITVHVPNTGKNAGMVNATLFDQMKKGVVFINTARAAVVHERDLLRALKNGTVRTAVIDVFGHPPEGVNWELVQHPRVLATPHIAGVSQESLARVSAYIGESVTNYLTVGTARGLINKGVKLAR